MATCLWHVVPGVDTMTERGDTLLLRKIVGQLLGPPTLGSNAC